MGLMDGTGAASPTRRMDAGFVQFCRTLADDLRQHARDTRDRRNATASDRRALPRSAHWITGIITFRHPQIAEPEPLSK
jgi:hypothetical protein